MFCLVRQMPPTTGSADPKERNTQSRRAKTSLNCCLYLQRAQFLSNQVQSTHLSSAFSPLIIFVEHKSKHAAGRHLRPTTTCESTSASGIGDCIAVAAAAENRRRSRQRAAAAACRQWPWQRSTGCSETMGLPNLPSRAAMEGGGR